MKYCSKCGKQLDDNDKFCTECGEQLVKNEIPVAYSQTQQVNSTTIYPNGETEEERKEGNKLGIISLCLYFGAPVVSFILSLIVGFIAGVTKTTTYSISPLTTLIGSLSGIAGLAAYVVMIVGRIKYPKNTLCKVVMWIYIVLLILCILAFILLIAFCYITCITTDLSGCN